MKRKYNCVNFNINRLIGLFIDVIIYKRFLLFFINYFLKESIMNTTQLECFLSVAKHLNYTKAANEIKKTQPAITHSIKTLEDELGFPLFERTNKSVALTKEGILFLPDAEKIMQIAFSAKERLLSHEIAQTLDIGCHNYYEIRLLPKVIQTLKNDYASLIPYIHHIPFESLATLLENGQLDLIFGFKHQFSNNHLHYLKLFDCPIICVFNKDHYFAQCQTISTKELSGSAIFCNPQKIPEFLYQIQISALSKTKITERYFCDDYESAITFVKANLGYAILPDIHLPREDDLCYIKLKDIPSYSFGVYYLNTQKKEIIKAFCHAFQKIIY